MVAMANMTLQTLTNSYNQWIVYLIMGTLISGWVFKQKERIEMQMKKTEITPITWNKNQINPLLPRSSFLLQDVSKNGCSDYLWAAQKTNCLLREVNGRQIRKGRIVQRYWFQVCCQFKKVGIWSYGGVVSPPFPPILSQLYHIIKFEIVFWTTLLISIFTSQ